MIGQARRMNGETALALRAFREYLREVPDAPSRAMVEKLIAELEHTDAGAPK
jgi:hypothetical protein